MSGDFTHFDESGASRMVDVSGKHVSKRTAKASAVIQMSKHTLELIQGGGVAKGNVLEVARLAGIMGAKRTGELIPLCHPVSLEAMKIDFEAISDISLKVVAEATAVGRTGVEMEALTAVAVAALTVYDMCKAVDRDMVVGPLQLEEKTGGRRGTYVRISVPSTGDSGGAEG